MTHEIVVAALCQGSRASGMRDLLAVGLDHLLPSGAGREDPALA